MLNIVATERQRRHRARGPHGRRDLVPGTLLFGVDDPDGDDNGPGNYAYPTAGDFKPGAYDLQRFEVYDTGDRIIFRVRTRDLTPTFGNPLGAQLIDVYVHVPGASPDLDRRGVPAAQLHARAVEQADRGPGLRPAVRRRGGATLGQVTISANDISRYITFSVTKASLGTPGPGWGFTVALTGQDGFSPDQARGFQPTPQAYQFGVCATASSDPHCTVDPSTVPKAMDTLTPPAELDYTLHPVVLTPVTIP